MKNLILIAILYALVGIVTFGHCAANTVITRTHDGKEHPFEIENRVGGGLFAGFFWPLYWSWEYFETSAEKG